MPSDFVVLALVVVLLVVVPDFADGLLVCAKQAEARPRISAVRSNSFVFILNAV